jgi:hypothetical protein
MAEVPQMALRSCLRLAPPMPAVPQMAEFVPAALTCLPQIWAVDIGIAGLIGTLFRLEQTIELLSDDHWFFMSFASFFISFTFLLIAVDDDGAVGNTCTPDHTCAPNYV